MLAAAIRAGAQVIVTANLRDFPDAELAQFGIEAKHPDEFVMDLFHLDGVRVHQAVSATATAWRNPPGTPADVCDRLAAAGYLFPRLRSAAERNDRLVWPSRAGSNCPRGHRFSASVASAIVTRWMIRWLIRSATRRNGEVTWP